MPVYIKRLFIIFSISILFLSCDLEKAEKEYKKGNYIHSIDIILKYLDKKPERLSKIKPKIKEDLTHKFSNIIEHYTYMAENNPDSAKRLEGNISLFTIYSMIEGREYTKNFEPLNNFINQNDIADYFKNSKRLSNEIFLYSINDIRDYDNAVKVSDYLQDMDTAINSVFKNSRNTSLSPKYREMKKDIAKTRADYYISVAEIIEKKSNYDSYRKAQKLYLNASEIYSDYETNYRNSYSKYSSTKYKADLIDAKRNYDKGLELYSKGRSSRADLRDANKYFIAASNYVPDYENVKKLILETEKGFFKYRITSDYSDFSTLILNSMKNIGKRTDSNPELVFEYKEDIDYKTSSLGTDVKNLTEKVRVGTDSSGNPIYENYSFTKKTVILKETVTIKYSFRVKSSFYNNFKNDSVSYTNDFTNVTYSGRVPQNYMEKSEKPLGKSELIKKARPELENEFSYQLKSIIYDLERM